jgi:hypothetical protein
MAWAQYVLNEFIDDFLDTHNSNKEFHYSWILLLLAMVLWQPPRGFEWTTGSRHAFEAPHFLRLHENKDPHIQNSHNDLFQEWYQQLIQATMLQERILHTLMDMYDGYLLFECTLHNVCIYPSDDQGIAMTLLPFCITEDDIQQGMVEWPTHLQPLPS